MATAGPTLVFEAAEQGSVVMAQLTGVINEDNSLDERLTATRGKGVLIDLANVERINSCGVRDWVRFAQRLEAAGNALYLLRCSPVVVAQLNMVRNFCGEKGQVVSFQAPYICPNCDEERTETFPSSKVSQGKSPEAICPNCQSQMEFDDLPDLYFAFAKIHGPKAVPQDIQAALDAFKNGVPVGTRISSTPSPATPASGSTRPSSTMPALKPATPSPAAAPAPAAAARPLAPAAPPARPSNPGLPAMPQASAAAASRPSNPGLSAMPQASAAAAARPSNPALRPPASAASAALATPSPAAASAASVASAAARRPSQPGLPPVSAPGASGPKPARPLMGGSPFPTRSSGLKQGMPAPGAPGDPTKK